MCCCINKKKKYILFVTDKILSFYKLHAWAGLFIHTQGFMLWLRIGQEWVGMTLETTDLQVQIFRPRSITQSTGSSFPALIHFPLYRNSFMLRKLKSVNEKSVGFHKPQHPISCPLKSCNTYCNYKMPSKKPRF